jgi:hypothetical protein
VREKLGPAGKREGEDWLRQIMGASLARDVGWRGRVRERAKGGTVGGGGSYVGGKGPVGR